jgi:hypothetical protein
MANHSSLLLALFTRDLNKLKDELNLYSAESNIWKVEPNISNSAGNLTLHLIGNLNHFVGAVLGKTNYVRNRDLEFSQKDVPRAAMTGDIDKTIEMLTAVLSKVSNEDLDLDVVFTTPDKPDNAGKFLLGLTAHLAYHLGQINYHRRLLDK